MSLNKSFSARKTADSAIKKIMPFSKDIELRECYINFFGALRLGKLLEDLDLIAGQVAYKHTEGWNVGLQLLLQHVTALTYWEICGVTVTCSFLRA